jgi:hypothetical protein
MLIKHSGFKIVFTGAFTHRRKNMMNPRETHPVSRSGASNQTGPEPAGPKFMHPET